MKFGADETCGDALAAFLDEEVRRVKLFHARRSRECMRQLRGRGRLG
jgi:hypothetical protein